MFISDPTIWSMYDQILTELALMAKQRFYKGERLSTGLESLVEGCNNILNGTESLKGYLLGLYQKKIASSQPKTSRKKQKLQNHPQLSHVAIDRRIQKGITENLEQAKEFIESLCSMLATKQEPQEGTYKFAEGIKWIFEKLVKALVQYFPNDSQKLVDSLLSHAK